MDAEAGPPRLFPNRWTDATGPGDITAGYDSCSCFEQYRVQAARKGVRFHGDRQDTSAAGWRHLLALIEQAAADGREVFRPLAELSPQERREVITLPPQIGTLTAVKHLVLYRSNLVRIPPEIGAMTSLEEFTPYTSHRLHWFPYELTRCRNLVRSTVSTRSLYGNVAYRPPFPRLQPRQVPPADPNPRQWGGTSLRTCSVCGGPFTGWGVRQVWISLRVATDVLPLLASTCSDACVARLPQGADGHIQTPHDGGRSAIQPAPRDRW